MTKALEGLTGIAALEAEMRDRLAAKDAVIAGERDARERCERALRSKDEAMSVLFKRMADAGVDYSDFLP